MKSNYGGGYHLFLNVKKRSLQSEEVLVARTKKFVSAALPEASLLSEFNGNLVYQVPLNSCSVSYVFKHIV